MRQSAGPCYSYRSKKRRITEMLDILMDCIPVTFIGYGEAHVSLRSFQCSLYIRHTSGNVERYLCIEYRKLTIRSWVLNLNGALSSLVQGHRHSSNPEITSDQESILNVWHNEAKKRKQEATQRWQSSRQDSCISSPSRFGDFIPLLSRMTRVYPEDV
jgi:hypothetical protein